MYCFKCENEITIGTVCGNCGYDNKENNGFLFSTTVDFKAVAKVVEPLNRSDRNFVIENGVLKKYKGFATEVEIPYGVTEIGVGVFRQRSDIKKVTIPDTVKIIGISAFAFCENLVEVKLSDCTEKIGTYAFAWCENLGEIRIPDTTNIISDNAFFRCRKLEKVSYPETSVLGKTVFDDCSKLKPENIEIRKVEKAPEKTQEAPVFSDSTKEFLAKAGYQQVVDGINDLGKYSERLAQSEDQIKRLEAKIKELEKEIERAEKVIGEYKARDKKLKELMGE